MNQLINNLQAALAALRMAKPNPAQWSGPAATAFTHRIDLLEIEFTVLSSLLSAVSIGSFAGGGLTGPIGGIGKGGGLSGGLGGGSLGGIIGGLGSTPVVPFEQLIAQLGFHG